MVFEAKDGIKLSRNHDMRHFEVLIILSTLSLSGIMFLFQPSFNKFPFSFSPSSTLGVSKALYQIWYLLSPILIIFAQY